MAWLLFNKTSVGAGPGMGNLQFFSSCILLALCTISSSAKDFISIDCGSSGSYVDENGITWTGDGEYVKTGESRSVEPSDTYDSGVTGTLRVFTNRRKNCYEVGPVKAGRVLVRATFYYGNYDGKSSPPEFYLILGGNYWGWINNSGSVPSRYEIIYVTKEEWISVCLIQDTDQEGLFFPYISALEVRSLGQFMYGGLDDTYPLFNRGGRVDYGSNATVVRYPDDPYDRRWIPETYTNGTVIKISGDQVFSSAMVSDDEPPSTVLKTAVASNSNSSRNSTIPILLSFPVSNISVYINMYFCELISLNPNQTRSFYLYKDNQRFSPLISPPYGNCTALNFLNLTVSSNTSFSLVATQNSTLPPLINALEILPIGNYPIYNLTHANDVKGLALLQETFGSLKDWSGDPCVPTDVVWDWVRCNYDSSIPRVTSLVISGYGMSGLLPDFSSMDALNTINLSNNSLRGNIPDFLGHLPNLQILNLENNQFNGTIPASLLTKKGLILRVGGNPKLCPSNSSISCEQDVPTGGPVPAANSSISNKTTMKNILQMLFTIIIPSIVLLHFNY